MNAPVKEPSFRESVDLMFNRAVALMDLPPGTVKSHIRRGTIKLKEQLAAYALPAEDAP